MYSIIHTLATVGIDGIVIAAETDVSTGLPDFSMVGFLSSSVREARDRVRVALRNSGFSLQPRRITVNLSPADIRKDSTAFDLAIAIGILVSHGTIGAAAAEGLAFIGELALNGSLRPVRGVISMVMAAVEGGFSGVVLPEENAAEGVLVSGIDIYPAQSLADAVSLISDRDKRLRRAATHNYPKTVGDNYDVDFSQVNGQDYLRRAAEIAAAGMHNLLMVGPPGSGKTMIAKRLPTILPEMTPSESLEVTKIYSIRGLLPKNSPLISRRPFRSPHHTISAAALTGGGSIPNPGEISLASRGVLFLDELPEFARAALETLRQPLEDRCVTVSRVRGTHCFPADCMVAAAMNPCPCGYYPDRNRCSCSETQVAKYLHKISRPLLDRMDICVGAPPVSFDELRAGTQNENSATIRGRVKVAHDIQQRRFFGQGIHFNSQMHMSHIEKYCRLSSDGEKILGEMFDRLGLSARAYHRILKLSRTIADLAGEEDISTNSLTEAAGFRNASILQ